jgi:uncharacterized protein YbaP (TraB family)
MNGKRAGTRHRLVLHALFALLCAWGVAGAAPDSRYERGLLWKIERPGVAASYLFGTIHSDDPAATQLASPVQQAFDRSATVILEVSLDAQTLQSLTDSLLIADGASLESILGESLYQRAVAAMSQQGVPESVVERMKPWAVAVTLMMPPAHSGVVLDQLLYEDAVAAGKQVEGLETVGEQMDLFEGLPRQDQITLLQDTLDHLPEIGRELMELLQAWRERDLERLMEINRQYMQYGDPRLAESFNRRVIVERNQRMADRLQRHLQKGRCFIGVGALHLPGEQGLLNLLAQRGYTVSAVY